MLTPWYWLKQVDTVLQHQKAHNCNAFQYNPSSNSTCDVREMHFFDV